MRLSKSGAEAEAVRLAKEFVAANGYVEWTCMGAKPDSLSPGYKKRKNVIKWCVVFDRSTGTVTIDGPVIVSVDIETGAADFC